MSKTKIYLAIPYSGLHDLSYEISCEVAADLLRKGYLVFSPIAQFHPIAVKEGLPGNFDFWHDLDKTFIEWCDEVHIIVIGSTGYDLIDKSSGVKGEKEMAKEFNKLVKYIHYNGKHLQHD